LVDEEILTALKVDLQISTDKMDTYLVKMIQAAKSYIQTEGIQLTCSTGDGMLVEMYAAYLYRRRREENVAMPRMLRWALNNRLFSQKAGAADG
jgi:hypothetical protein